MKTQISRDSFQPDAPYSGVYLQQGRMILDADWNELSDIQKTRLVAALRDAIAGGAPRVNGLRMVAVPDNSTNIRIQPGVLYVDGVPARLDAEAPLEIDQQPDYPIQAAFSSQSLRLYADVWERTITALEQAELMDAALHGADTATRTRTMLQVKWCPNTTDPLDDATNPPLGNAPLTLKLRQITSSGDKCDPCASQVQVDERLGNYLFRVEVHDLDGDWLTLKWSRDNGAEACRTDAMPPGFNQGPWVWEFFDDATERLLGNHFATNPQKLRGLIKEECVTPTGAQEPQQYVRHWDGYLRINLSTGEVTGHDRGVVLASGTAESEAHGRVNLSTGVLKVNLELMEITLATSGQWFVPGDYWQAEVREARHTSGDTVLDAEPPRGVRHHYLFLGEIGVNKKLVTQDDAFRRRMTFPPLSDITAQDVGFTDHCAGLFAGARNVQDALDNLCNIGAEDIAYLLPNCGANEGKSIKDNLKALLDPDSDGKLTVKTALDNLLCQLNAGSLPYSVPDCGAAGSSVRELLGLAAGGSQVGPVLDKLMCELRANDLPLDKSDTSLCSDLQAAAVVTVQDALQVLCNKSAGGCAVVVTSPDHLGVLLTEFANSTTATDLWVCLKPGTYPLDAIPAISGKRSLRICGAGREAVTITFSGDKLSIDAAGVILENLSFTFTTGTGQLVLNAATSQTRGCRIARSSTSSSGPPMIAIGGRSNSPCRLEWRDNILYAQIRKTTGVGNDWAGPTIVGDAELSGLLLDFGKAEILADKAAYDEALSKAAARLVSLPKSTRANWGSNLRDRVTVATTTPLPVAAATNAIIPTAGRVSAVSFGELLNADRIELADAALAVEDLLVQWISYSPHYAIRLEDARVGGGIAENQIDGWLLLGNGVKGEPKSDPGVVGAQLDSDSVTASGQELRVEGNRLVAVRGNLAKGSVRNGRLIKPASGYTRLFLTGNSIAETENTLVAASFVGQGNTWSAPSGDVIRMGSVVADRATFTGNLFDGPQGQAVLGSTVAANSLASTGNARIQLEPAA